MNKGMEKKKTGIYCQRQKDDLGGITTPTPIMYIEKEQPQKNRLGYRLWRSVGLMLEHICV